MPQPQKESAQKIELTGERVDRGLQAAGAVTEALREIASAVADTAGLVAEIAESTQRQAHGINEVRESLGQIEGVTQANTAQAEETSAASQELAKTANQLADLVNSFQLPGSSKTGKPPISQETTSSTKKPQPEDSQPQQIPQQPVKQAPKPASEKAKATAVGPENLLPLGDVNEPVDTKSPKEVPKPSRKRPLPKPRPQTAKKPIVETSPHKTKENDNLGWPEPPSDENINPADVIDLSDDSGRY